MEEIPEGQVYMPRLEPTALIRLADRNHTHYPSRHCTILKKRWLSDGLPGHMFPSTREPSEDVSTYTWHTKSLVGANASSLLFPEGQPIRLVKTPNPRCQ